MPPGVRSNTMFIVFGATVFQLESLTSELHHYSVNTGIVPGSGLLFWSKTTSAGLCWEYNYKGSISKPPLQEQ